MSLNLEARKKRILNVLRKVRLVTHACKRTGISTSSFYRWRQDDPEFDALCEEAIGEATNMINDMAEGVLITKIKNGDEKVAYKWLTHHKQEYRPGHSRRVGREDEMPKNFIELLHRKAKRYLSNTNQ